MARLYLLLIGAVAIAAVEPVRQFTVAMATQTIVVTATKTAITSAAVRIRVVNGE